MKKNLLLLLIVFTQPAFSQQDTALLKVLPSDAYIVPVRKSMAIRSLNSKLNVASFKINPAFDLSPGGLTYKGDRSRFLTKKSKKLFNKTLLRISKGFIETDSIALVLKFKPKKLDPLLLIVTGINTDVAYNSGQIAEDISITRHSDGSYDTSNVYKGTMTISFRQINFIKLLKTDHSNSRFPGELILEGELSNFKRGAGAYYKGNIHPSSLYARAKELILPVNAKIIPIE